MRERDGGKGEEGDGEIGLGDAVDVGNGGCIGRHGCNKYF